MDLILNDQTHNTHPIKKCSIDHWCDTDLYWECKSSWRIDCITGIFSSYALFSVKNAVS